MIILLIFIACLLLITGVEFQPIVLEDIRKDEITVVVRGEVEEEKELNLELYSTMEEALEEVELLEDADLSSLNPSTVLKDGDVIQIPKAEEVKKISINTGTKEELCTLPGIGEATAERIIEERETNGLFQSLEDLTRVKGIGEAKLEKLREYITL